MNNDKPKKKVIIGESKVQHVHKGFAIPVIILFITLILIFSIGWGGVLVADAAADIVINPIIQAVDPDAEPIDVMAIMSPPTSESEAAKVYAEFPSLNLDKVAAAIGNAFSAFPKDLKILSTDGSDIVSDIEATANQLLGWYNGTLTPAFGESATIISNTIQTYPQGLERWYDDHLPFRSIIFNTNQQLEGYVEAPYSTVQNRIAATANRLQQALLIVLDRAPQQGTTPGNPGGEDLENPGGNDFIPIIPGGNGGGNDETDDDPPEFPEETPPPFVPENTETGDGAETDGQGGVAVCKHEIGEGEIETPPTCTDWGVMKYPCTKCGKVLKREYTKKAAHQYVDADYTVPMCGEKYTVESTCSICGDHKVQNLVKTHVKGEKIKTVEASIATYGYTLVRCRDCEGEYRMNLKNKLYDNGFFLPTYHNNQVIEGREKWLFYRLNDSEAYFKGTNLMTDAELQEYVSVMSTLNQLCKERGIQLQICIWPNKDQAYPEYLGITPDTNIKRVDRLVEYVRANSDIKIIYPLAELKSMKPYMDVYLKYDTHWNCAGGFIGYQAMLESLGLETTSILDCPVFEYTGKETDESKLDPYYRQISGDMIGLGQLNGANYRGDHNYFIKYRSDVTVDSFTGANGAGDTRHTTAANAPNDFNFVMLADSYRVMQLTYLEKDFTDCFLTHRSHVNDADVKEAIKNSDILVIAAVERLETDILATARHIINILQEDAQ